MKTKKKLRNKWYSLACSTMVKMVDARKERDTWRTLYNNLAKECNRVKAILSQIKKAVDES